MKLCDCGCGCQVGIAKDTNKKKGITKGKPLRYVHGHNAKQDERKRFESKIERIPECGCWIWVGTVDKKGYGAFSLRRKNMKAHRVSWMLYYGNMPPQDKGVLHRCDTPLCVNPYHLFLGTQLDNIRDCVSKGRDRHIARYGQDVGNSKFKNEDITKIKSDNRTARVIAKEWGVARSTISAIKCGQNWSFLKEKAAKEKNG